VLQSLQKRCASCSRTWNERGYFSGTNKENLHYIEMDFSDEISVWGVQYVGLLHPQEKCKFYLDSFHLVC
jgi:hypothetical protein